MTKSLALAWIVGEALLIWRQIHGNPRPPVPGAMVGISALFVGMAVVADIVPRAEPVVVMAAWGLDLAGFLNLWPAGLGGEIQQASTASGETNTGKPLP